MPKWDEDFNIGTINDTKKIIDAELKLNLANSIRLKENMSKAQTAEQRLEIASFMRVNDTHRCLLKSADQYLKQGFVK